MSKPRVFLAVVLVLSLSALMFSCSDDAQQNPSPVASNAPLSPPALQMGSGGNLSGAIFTTTPDGGIVNENTHYQSKLEVYLDGGPRNNAPQHAAALPDGWYVFQVTDPPGKVLLSEDPSKCRVLEIENGVIVRLVDPSEFGMTCEYTVGKGGNAVTYPCHIQDDPDGVAGSSGRHDTNTDADHGDSGAIVVQLMPFLDTPNPGGVYKAWLTPFDAYLSMGGDLEAMPVEQKVKGKIVGFENDPGFGPPRNMVKTDNFKVKERPPRICVVKYEDTNGNGVQDAGEPEITGWPISITETLHDGTTVTNVVYTPVCRSLDYGTTVQVEEDMPEGWQLSYVLLDGAPVLNASTVIDVTFGPSQKERDLTFGNYKPVDIKAKKYNDCDADGIKDANEPYAAGFEFCLYSDDGELVDADDFVGAAEPACKLTGEDGIAAWTGLLPGEYTIVESEKSGWVASTPTSKTFDLDSGDSGVIVVGNYQPVSVTIFKFHDFNANGVRDYDEPYVEGFEFCLKDAAGNLVSADDFAGTPDPACQVTGAEGMVSWDDLKPAVYTVVETQKPNWDPTTGTSKMFDFTDCSANRDQSFEFGNILMLCRVTGGQVDESGNCSVCPEGSSGENRYTCGGQAGANTALQPQPKGEWTHSNKSGPAGKFTFHAGTASAPDGTEIDWISCSDPVNCDPARHAPAKQIDFGGVGTFKNMSGTVPDAIAQWVSVGSSLHYFEVNIDDLGEPGAGGWTDPDTGMCPADGFGLYGSQVLGNCACPDFYRIRIYATSSPSSEIIYEVQGYIAGGNFQIHPLTGYDTH